jgi:tetratricopeptide (TPR) repeat protein
VARIDREKVLQAAQKFVEKKKYDKAVLEYQKLIQEDPNDARTLLKIGDLLSKMLAWPDAIDTYEKVGKLYSHQGFALKAIAVYKQIREIIAKHVPQLEERYAHIAPKLAELYQQLGLTSDALAALDEVATRLQRQQRDAEAIEVFRKIVELDPTNPLPHLRLAEALSRVKDVEGAVQEFGMAAQQLVELGRRDDALKVLERLLHHRPDPEKSRLAAELYLSRGQPADGMQALAKLQLCFQANPRDFDTLALLARAFDAIRQPEKSIEVQKEMARVARDSGRDDLFQQVLAKLQRVAPHDEGVRRLMHGPSAPPGAPSVAPQPPPMVAPPPHVAPPPTVQAQRPPPMAPPVPPSSAQPVGRPQPPPMPPPSTARMPPPPPPPMRGPSPTEEISEVSEVSDISYQSVQDSEISYQSVAPEGAPGGDYQDAPPEVMIEGNLQVAEELSEAPADASEQLAQILADAQSFRRVRLFAKALETLRIGLEIEPRSFEVREMYRDVLLEAGDTAGAVEEMLMLASLYIDSLDGESAARMLQDALAYDPQNTRAVQMLQELGYEIVDEGQEGMPAGEEAVAEDQPLPAYSLVDESEAAAGAYEEPAPQTQGRGGAYVGESGLPSFPLEPESDAAFDLVQPHAEGAVADSYDQLPASDEGPVVSSRGAAELEAALEEAEFFASRGLFDDAKAILNEQMSRHPNHPLLLERMEEIATQEQATARGSGTREMPRDRSFDIAASLDAIESLGGGPVTTPGAFEQPSQQVDVEEVFAKFKEGVAKQISLDDAQSHYDLGVAYKEMQLLEDSVREFDLAARDPKRECMCRAMIGQIQMERGNVNEAIDAFMRGLHAQVRTPDQEMMLCFEIGSAYEVKKMTKEALSYYQRVLRRDPSYRDVQDRVRRLSKNEPIAPVRQAAVGADDEFDRAFDDIIGKG